MFWAETEDNRNIMENKAHKKWGKEQEWKTEKIKKMARNRVKTRT